MGSAVACDGECLFQDVDEGRRIKGQGDGGEERGDGREGRVGGDSGVGEGEESQIWTGKAMLSGQNGSGGGGDESEGRIPSRVRSLVVRDVVIGALGPIQIADEQPWLVWLGSILGGYHHFPIHRINPKRRIRP